MAKSTPFIYKAAHDFTRNSAADNVRYFELRTNPIPKQGGTAEEMMKTIQKGVEDAQQATMIRDLGCNKIQGYYFGRPMPAAEAAQIAARTGAARAAA